MKIKIAYIGGGSKEWAKVFMNDLALATDLSGEISLYDIDKEAAIRNKKIGDRINMHPLALSKWDYVVTDTIEAALTGADFVAISILPGLIETMRVDVHTPEKYGLFQSVGDTVGPGGVIRSMRTVPLFEYFAKKIKACCPKAWVINFTNPMSICIRTLTDVFPQIKAFGCCHEVFHTQDFLCKVLEVEKGISIKRKQLFTEVQGVNHFTWISKASYQNIDVLGLLPEFIAKNFINGYNEFGKPDAFRTDYFACANRVKMDLYSKYGVLAAGDRHLAEFMDIDLYLSSREKPDFWKFALTPVQYRIERRDAKIKEAIQLSEGNMPISLIKSNEEAIDLIQALLGKNQVISNVNVVNNGQMKGLELGRIVETNALFYNDHVIPLMADILPDQVLELIKTHSDNLEILYSGIKSRNFKKIYEAFAKQPLCSMLFDSECRLLFKEMCMGTKDYLHMYYDFAELERSFK